MKPLWTMLSNRSLHDGIGVAEGKKWRPNKGKKGGYTPLKLTGNGLFVFGGARRKKTNNQSPQDGESGGKCITGDGGNLHPIDNTDSNKGWQWSGHPPTSADHPSQQEATLRVPLARIEELEEYRKLSS